MILKYITKEGIFAMLDISLGITIAGIIIGFGVSNPLYFLVLGLFLAILTIPIAIMKKESISHSRGSDEQ